MIQLRFITLVIAISSILGVQALSISNRTSHLTRTTPTALESLGENSVLTTGASRIGPHLPRSFATTSASRSRYSGRKMEEDLQILPRDSSPTPAPTGPSQESTTVHVNDVANFAILLPRDSRTSIGDSEVDAQSYCFGSDGCKGQPMLAPGFITAADVQVGGSGDGRFIQVTGCIDPTAMGLSESDEGGQYDVRFPNGAQCTFGGYGKSFIEQVEPAARRFCLRCCFSADDQTNCNSHNDEAGCVTAVPGKYDFPEKGVSCA